MFTHTNYNSARITRIAAYAKLIENYTIYRAGDTIVDRKGNTYTVAHTHISGHALSIVALDRNDNEHTLEHKNIRKV
jgi:hypothetical protein